MKRIILISVMLLTTSFGFSQDVNENAFGLKGGLNYATITKGNFDEGADPRTSYYLGFYGVVPVITNLLSIQPELVYSRQGFSAVYQPIIGNSYKEEYRLDYLNIPILAKLHVGKVVSFEAGPQFGFKVNEKIKSENTSSDRDNVNNFDTALAGGMSFAFNGVVLSGRYTYSFNEVIKDTNSKNSVIQVGIGFNF